MTNPITTPNEETNCFMCGFPDHKGGCREARSIDDHDFKARPDAKQCYICGQEHGPLSGLSAGDRKKLEEAIEAIDEAGLDGCGCRAAIPLIREVLSSASTDQPSTETAEDRELRALAEKATDGPWYVMKDGFSKSDKSPVIYAPLSDLHYIAKCQDFATIEAPNNQNNADFIAACSPDRIISLLDRLAGKDKENQGERRAELGK